MSRLKYYDQATGTWKYADKAVTEQEGGGDNVFNVEYRATPFADIKAASDAGKVCKMKVGNRIYYLVAINSSNAQFIWIAQGKNRAVIACTSAGVWTDETSDSVQTQAITDPGNYFATDTVEGALQEIGAELNNLPDIPETENAQEIPVDSEVTPGSDNLITSGAVAAAIAGGGGGGWRLLRTVSIEQSGVLSIEVTSDDDGTPFSELNITDFVALVSVAYGEEPSYKYYMTVINGSDVARNTPIINALSGIQRRYKGTFIGDGTLWLTHVDINGSFNNAQSGFCKIYNANWEPQKIYGNSLNSLRVHLYTGDFAVGSKIIIWGR